MKLKVRDKETEKELQGRGKTNFKEQIFLIFALFITMASITIYHSRASVYSF